jgi:hypothetical protein
MSAKKKNRPASSAKNPPSSGSVAPAPTGTVAPSMAAAASASSTGAVAATNPQRQRLIANITMVVVCLYIAALYLLALDQWFKWGIFGP